MEFREKYATENYMIYYGEHSIPNTAKIIRLLLGGHIMRMHLTGPCRKIILTDPVYEDGSMERRRT